MLRSALRRYTTQPAVSSTKLSAYVRPWDAILTPADALIIARHVQQTYGPDYEMPQMYQFQMFFAFANAESIGRIPDDGEVLRVEAPLVSSDERPGGIGLDELYAAFEGGQGLPSLPADEPSSPSTSNTPENSNSSETSRKRTIGFRISPARTNAYTISHIVNPSFSIPRQQALGKAFLSWGGFRTPEKVKFAESEAIDTPKELEPLDNVERHHTRRALYKWSKRTGLPDPSVLYEGEEWTREHRRQQQLELQKEQEQTASPTSTAPEMVLEDLAKDDSSLASTPLSAPALQSPSPPQAASDAPGDAPTVPQSSTETAPAQAQAATQPQNAPPKPAASAEDASNSRISAALRKAANSPAHPQRPPSSPQPKRRNTQAKTPTSQQPNSKKKPKSSRQPEPVPEVPTLAKRLRSFIGF